MWVGVWELRYLGPGNGILWTFNSVHGLQLKHRWTLLFANSADDAIRMTDRGSPWNSLAQTWPWTHFLDCHHCLGGQHYGSAISCCWGLAIYESIVWLNSGIRQQLCKEESIGYFNSPWSSLLVFSGHPKYVPTSSQHKNFLKLQPFISRLLLLLPLTTTTDT